MSARTDQGDRVHGPSRLARALRDRWWVIIAMAVVLGGVAVAISLLALEPRYSATAQVAYSQTDADVVSKALTDAGTAGLPKTIATDALVLQTLDFADLVSQAMDGSVGADVLHSSVQVPVPTGVEVINIKATAADPDQAAAIANAFADEFIKTRQQEMRRLLQTALDLVQGRIGSIASTNPGETANAALEQQRLTLTTLISGPIADYKVIERAAAPASPFFPRPLVNLLWGVAAGLVLGFALALVMSSTDRKIRDRGTLEDVTDLPVLGAMPAAQGRHGDRRAAVGFRRGNEPLLESMRVLSANLKALGFGETSRSILVSSTAPGEGKNALAVNLALSMALAGDRVILVDADLRNPSVDQYLDIPNTDGLAGALADSDLNWSERVQAVDLVPFVDPRLMSERSTEESGSGVSKFLCLTSGALPPDPAALLDSPALRMLIADLRGYSDYVIVNGPPMAPGSDSLLLARSVDTVIMTTALAKQTTAEAKQVRQLLARAEIDPLGLVIVGAKAQSYDVYRIRSGQGEDELDFES
jgi:Mrp family chromosome partitioning ATPase/capsular polysaccharide biosynthesis protein